MNKVFNINPKGKDFVEVDNTKDMSEIVTIPGQAEGLSTIVDRYLRDGITPIGNGFTAHDTNDERVEPPINSPYDTTFGVDIDDVSQIKQDLLDKQAAAAAAQQKYYDAIRAQQEAQRSRSSEANAGNVDNK